MENDSLQNILLIGRKGSFTGVGKYCERIVDEFYKMKLPVDYISYDKLRLNEIISSNLRLLFDRHDIIHIMYDYDPYFLLYPLKKIITENTKLVVTVHDSVFYYPKIATWNTLERKYIWMSRQLIKSADHFIVNSSQTKEELIHFDKIPQDKITITPLGVDERFYYKLPLDKRKGDILILSRLGSISKGSLRTISIAKWNKLFKFKLTIVGAKGKYFKYLLKYLDHYTSFLHNPPDKKLAYLYNSAKVFIWPSLYEGFGIPILEAQKCGTPVIVFKNSRLPEEVTKECIKVRFNRNEVKQVVEELTTDENLWRYYSKKSIDYAKKFTWKKTAMKTVGVYKKFLVL
ncbi:MAG: glycosyltransferase family 4 protein [Candidatus Aenigmarchaeota archaeon]|nr:glycosyltransferase family 4 protein [Candidatus Aenigmarchaeota archaeon]